MELNVTVSGLESIDNDWKAFQADFTEKLRKAMDDVGADMLDALKKHIISDVYGAYRPKTYQRRSKDESLGTPLSDMAKNATVYNKGAGVTLDYSPTGAHANENWHTADGNDLIGRIEKKSPPYFQKAQNKVPERPFWQNFVNEMVDQGELERYFAAAMAMQGEIVETGGAVTREPQDGEY